MCLELCRGDDHLEWASSMDWYKFGMCIVDLKALKEDTANTYTQTLYVVFKSPVAKPGKKPELNQTPTILDRTLVASLGNFLQHTVAVASLQRTNTQLQENRLRLVACQTNYI